MNTKSCCTKRDPNKSPFVNDSSSRKRSKNERLSLAFHIKSLTSKPFISPFKCVEISNYVRCIYSLRMTDKPKNKYTQTKSENENKHIFPRFSTDFNKSHLQS